MTDHARLLRSPVCGCGRALTPAPDHVSSRGAAYRSECPLHGTTEHVVEPARTDADPERTSLRSAVLALGDEYAEAS